MCPDFHRLLCSFSCGFFFLVNSGVSFQSVHLIHSVVWVSVMYFSPLFVPFSMGEGSHGYS